MVHIQAENEDDLFFTLGFVHADERVWQMDYQRRIGAFFNNSESLCCLGLSLKLQIT